MDRLPDELLLMIFRRIDDFREMVKLERVCRRWCKVMRDHGWKHVRQVAYACNIYTTYTLAHRTPALDQWVVPFGERCGKRLVECSFYQLNIDSNLLRLIAENLPTRHLTFQYCQLQSLEANVLLPFREFAARLRSLTFFHTAYHPHISPGLLGQFPCLRHLGLEFSSRYNYANDDISRHFSANLRSLYLSSYRPDFLRPDMEQMFAKVLTNSSQLTALYLKGTTVCASESVLLRISELKNLRYLHLDSTPQVDLFSSCLANLHNLNALQMCLSAHQQLSDVFRCRAFRGLVHLSLFLSANFDLRIYPNSLEFAQQIGCQMLKIAHNGNLEHLNMPKSTWFTIAEIDQLVRLCPNLHSIYASSPSSWESQLYEVAELSRVVAEQWRAGTRKYLPLRIWISEVPGHRRHRQAVVWQDPFLSIHYVVDSSFVPRNMVLDTLFRDKVFNGHDDGGTPSFVTEYYPDCVPVSHYPMKDLVLS